MSQSATVTYVLFYMCICLLRHLKRTSLQGAPGEWSMQATYTSPAAVIKGDQISFKALSHSQVPIQLHLLD